MLKQLFVTILAVVSSFLLLTMYDQLLNGDAFPTAIVWCAISTSLITAVIMAWPTDVRFFDGGPWMIVLWIFLIGWRAWGKTLVGMGIQALTVLAFLAIGFREDLDSTFIAHFSAVAVPTAFLLAALIFAPEKKEQPTSQRSPHARETAMRL